MNRAVMDIDWVRSRFPSLDTDWAFFDNGGGSQILGSVLERINEYLVTSNVQHGASYEVSRLATERLAQAREAMANLVNARDASEIVMGGCTTLLLQMLATAIGGILQPGDEVVVSRGDHEANIGPWIGLEESGVRVRFWDPRPDSLQMEIEDLDAVLSDRTRLVAVTHASNVLGTINPIRSIADRVHAAGALLCVDGVAYAPHRAVDVQALDVDFYVFSLYKTFGPHHALLYGKRELLVELPARNFFFVPRDRVPTKFEAGNVNYELSYGMLGLMDYLQDMATARTEAPTQRLADDRDRPGGPTGTLAPNEARDAVDAAFGMIAEHEEVLCERLLGYLRGRPDVHIVGESRSDKDVRLPIVSFVVRGRMSNDIVEKMDAARVAIRFGDFHSTRLIDLLGLGPKNGVVRVSMAHYNTLEEVDRLVTALDAILT